jgi:hypothetical protein
MAALVKNVTVTPLAQNQLFVMNIVVNANVRKTLLDVDATNVLQHFMVLDKMGAHLATVTTLEHKMPSVTYKMGNVLAIRVPMAEDVTNVSLGIGIFPIVNLVNATVML